MSQVTRVRARPHLTLNSDGQKHTVVNALATFTLIAGVVAFALGFIVARHFIASWIGLAALVVGFYAQMISATREQRIVIVSGLVAGFVGLMLAFAHGGPFL
jgi:FtsH-binding integral membrane protein